MNIDFIDSAADDPPPVRARLVSEGDLLCDGSRVVHVQRDAYAGTLRILLDDGRTLTRSADDRLAVAHRVSDAVLGSRRGLGFGRTRLRRQAR